VGQKSERGQITGGLHSHPQAVKLKTLCSKELSMQGLVILEEILEVLTRIKKLKILR